MIGCNWLLGRVSFATRQELVEELLFIYDFYAPLPHGEKSLKRLGKDTWDNCRRVTWLFCMFCLVYFGRISKMLEKSHYFCPISRVYFFLGG